MENVCCGLFRELFVQHSEFNSGKRILLLLLFKGVTK